MRATGAKAAIGQSGADDIQTATMGALAVAGSLMLFNFGSAGATSQFTAAASTRRR